MIFPTTADLTTRGHWQRLSVQHGERWRFFYYYRGIRLPWIAWVLFS